MKARSKGDSWSEERLRTSSPLIFSVLLLNSVEVILSSYFVMLLFPCPPICSRHLNWCLHKGTPLQYALQVLYATAFCSNMGEGEKDSGKKNSWMKHMHEALKMHTTAPQLHEAASLKLPHQPGRQMDDWIRFSFDFYCQGLIPCSVLQLTQQDLEDWIRYNYLFVFFLWASLDQCQT